MFALKRKPAPKIEAAAEPMLDDDHCHCCGRYSLQGEGLVAVIADPGHDGTFPHPRQPVCDSCCRERAPAVWQAIEVARDHVEHARGQARGIGRSEALWRAGRLLEQMRLGKVPDSELLFSDDDDIPF